MQNDYIVVCLVSEEYCICDTENYFFYSITNGKELKNIIYLK